jgi:hypothetical protein
MLTVIEPKQTECGGRRVGDQKIVIAGSRQDRLNQETVVHRIINDQDAHALCIQ